MEPCRKMNDQNYLQNLTLGNNGSIEDALVKIEAMHSGYLFIVDDDGVVIACVTDGDVRRALMAGFTLDNPIQDAYQSDFVRAFENTPRELVIKHLENGIRAVPILDASGRLIEIATRDSFSAPLENRTFVRCRAPVRVTFCGGGSDVHDHFSKFDGAAVNATINLFCHASLYKRDDRRIYIESSDYKAQEEFVNFEALESYDGPLTLIVSVIKLLKPSFGFDLHIKSDFPPGSGLGGSAAVSAAVLGCFNEFKTDKLNKFELAELAYQAERLLNSIAGGWQDQYATIFGGFNYQIYKADGNTVLPLRLSKKTVLELEQRLVLVFTNITRSSGAVHKARVGSEENTKSNIINKNAALVEGVINALNRESWNELGQLLHEGWLLKRESNQKISDDRLDEIYSGALQNGAIGGKLLGAGSGGHFLFMSDHRGKDRLQGYFEGRGMMVVPFLFQQEGITSWSVRSERS